MSLTLTSADMAVLMARSHQRAADQWATRQAEWKARLEMSMVYLQQARRNLQIRVERMQQEAAARTNRVEADLLDRGQLGAPSHRLEF